MGRGRPKTENVVHIILGRNRPSDSLAISAPNKENTMSNSPSVNRKLLYRAPPQHHAQEMKDRESKRWLLEEFVKENEIRAVELEIAYKRFKSLAPSSGSGGKQATSSVDMDFNTWILVSSEL